MEVKIMTNEWYVYKLLDPRDNKPFYVGKGVKYRMYAHESCVNNGKIPNGNYRLYDKIKSILNDNEKIIYEQVYFTNDEDDAYDHEELLTDEIGLENLCNLFSGGKGKAYSGEKHWNWGNHWQPVLMNRQLE